MIPRKLLVCYTLHGEYTNGYYHENILSTFSVFASIQPLSDREMQSLPEGRRNKETYKLFSFSLLNTVEEQNRDVVIINGETFEVIKRGTWKNGIIDHYTYIVVKIIREEPYNYVEATINTGHNLTGDIDVTTE